MTLSEKIKHEARRLGFDGCAILKAERLNTEARHLDAWLAKGYHGQMTYMEKHFEKRVNPAELVPNAKSVVSVIANYYAPPKPAASNAARISNYATGDDYHVVMKNKLHELFDFICSQAGGVNGRAFVDSAPVLDKAWATKGGLGWIGKHTNLITPPVHQTSERKKSIGSYVFIGSLILDLPLDYRDVSTKDYCGSCTKCIDACPTSAIVEPFQVDSRKCISYLTIELKDNFTETESAMIGDWLYGCDICQEVCPWNRFAVPTSTQEFFPKAIFENLDIEELPLKLRSEEFKAAFKQTAMMRTKLSGLERNLATVKKNKSAN